MTIPQYIKLLNNLKDKSLAHWNDLTPVERELVDSSYEWLISNLNIKKGVVEQDAELQTAMDQFVDAVVEILRNNSTYQGKLSSFLTDMRNISKNMETFQATTNNLDLAKLNLKEVQKVVTDEVLNQYLDNGLNAHFAQPLRESIYRNILLGATMKDIKQTLNAYILSGQDKSGKLQSYVHNTAIQAVDTYTGYINQKLAETFKFTGFIISGSLIETSSTQCIYAVETAQDGYLNNASWEVVLDMARHNKKAKLIEGTTLKTLPLNKLHWGCRHDFTPIIKKEEVPIEPAKEKAKKAVKPEKPKEYTPEEDAAIKDILGKGKPEPIPVSPTEDKLINEVYDYGEKVPKEQRDALIYYTGGGYRVNRFLRSSGPLDPVDQRDTERISSFLQGAPKYNGVTYRGLYGTTKAMEAFESLRPGDLLSDKGFVSSSFDITKGWADFGMSTFETTPAIFIKIHGKNGVPIQYLSESKSEREVLFNKGTTFEVIGHKDYSNLTRKAMLLEIKEL